MSIDDDLPPQPSITAEERALELFTDRYELTRRFAEYLNEDSPRKQILFLYGDGGNGKSLLLKHLQQNICKRITASQWQQVKTRTDTELAEIIKALQPTDCLPVPSASLDFGLPALGDVQPQDRFYGLLLLRKALGESASGNTRLKFPRYDFACIWYLSNKGKSIDQIKSLFPLNEVAGFVTTAADAITGNPLGAIFKAFVDFGVQGWSEKLMQQFARLGVDKETQNRIRSQDLDRELVEMLPELFAEDLNAAMQHEDAPKRIALFFDTHEALWGRERNLPSEIFFYRDEWLRRLLRRLDLGNGIVAVVAGRERPRWNAATKQNTRIPSEFLDLQKVGHLGRADALVYLQKVGIADDELSQSLIDYASVQAGEVHPLYLGLGADVVLQAQNQGTTLTAADFRTLPEAEDQAKVLTERLLRYVDRNVEYAVRALSACRAFNFDLYCLLGEELQLRPSRPDFDLITGFSFVWQTAQRGQDWYRIHDLLRRLNDQQEDDLTQQAHQILEQQYRLADDIAEAIYHLNRLDWQQGVAEWNQVFEGRLKLSRYDDCRNLLEIRNELTIQSDFSRGYISQAEGDYYAQLARYSEAKQEYTEAIVAYDVALERAPDDTDVLNNKGSALASLGKLQAGLSQHQAALSSYKQAIAVYDVALKRAPNDITALNNKGLTLSILGKLQAGLSQHQAALSSYKQAIVAYDAALKRAPDYITVLNNKGNALQSLGKLQAGLSQHQAALSSYKQAIAAYDVALKRAPDYIYALNDKGLALQSLGDLQTGLSQHQAALSSYEQAIAAYDAALERTPDDIITFNNKGSALQSLGKLQAGLSQHQAALSSYKQAIVAYDAALKRAPDYIYALNNKGLALQRLSDLQAGLSQHQAALSSYKQAIVAYDAALKRAPDYIYALNNKGLALQGLGDLQTGLSQHQAALSSYEQATAVYNAALKRAPDYINALNNKGNALASLGKLQAGLSQHQAALSSYEQAIVAYDAALERAPNDINALNNRGLALANFGDLQARLAEHSAALDSYGQALSCFSRSLELAPNDQVQSICSQLQKILEEMQAVE